MTTTPSTPPPRTTPKPTDKPASTPSGIKPASPTDKPKGSHLFQKNYVHSNLEPGTENKPWDPRWRIAYRLTKLFGEPDDLNWYRKVVLTHPPEIVLLATLETLFKDREKPLTSKGAYFTGILKNYVKAPQ